MSGIGALSAQGDSQVTCRASAALHLVLAAVLLAIVGTFTFSHHAQAADKSVAKPDGTAISWDQKQAMLKAFGEAVGDFAFKMLRKPGGAKTVGLFIGEKISSEFAAFSPDDKLLARAVGIQAAQRTMNHIAQSFPTIRSTNDQRILDEYFAFIKAEEADPAFRQAQKVLALESLFDAIKAGDVRDAKDAVEAGADVNGRHELDGLSPLHYAAGTGRTKIVEVLCEAGAKLNEMVMAKGASKPRKTLEGWTALHLAAANGFVEVVTLLIEKGADKNPKDEKGITPLGRAVEAKDLEMVAVLKAAGAKEQGEPPAPAPAPEKAAPKSEAKEQGKTISAQQKALILEKLSADVEDFAAKLLQKPGGAKLVGLFINEKVKVVSDFAGFGPDDRAYARATGIRAMKRSMNTITQSWPTQRSQSDQRILDEYFTFIKEAEADPAFKKAQKAMAFQNLMGAIQVGQLREVREAIAAGADVNGRQEQTGFSPLLLAAATGKSSIVEVLCEAGASLNQTLTGKGASMEGFTALHFAALNGHEEVTQLLLGKGAEKNAKAGNGLTPLDLASALKKLEVVAILKAAGAKEQSRILVPQQANRPPPINTREADLALLKPPTRPSDFEELFEASARGVVGRAKAALVAGANVNGQDQSSGFTPLMIAVDNEHAEIVVLLLGQGATLDATNKLGNTALHIAAYKATISIPKLLLDKGAPVNAQNAELRTPLMIAANNGNKPAVVLLLEHGADATIEDKWGTALASAFRLREINPEIASLIEKAGTKGASKPAAIGTTGGTPSPTASKRQPTGDPNGNASVATIVSEPSAAELAMDRFIELLVRNDPESNKTPQLNLSLLDCARQGLPSSLRKCLERGAEIEATDAIGNSALMLAAQRGHLSVVKQLIDMGADVSKVNRQGKSALGLAKNAQIISALKEAPAKQ